MHFVTFKPIHYVFYYHFVSKEAITSPCSLKLQRLWAPSRCVKMMLLLSVAHFHSVRTNLKPKQERQLRWHGANLCQLKLIRMKRLCPSGHKKRWKHWAWISSLSNQINSNMYWCDCTPQACRTLKQHNDNLEILDLNLLLNHKRLVQSGYCWYNTTCQEQARYVLECGDSGIN